MPSHNAVKTSVTVTVLIPLLSPLVDIVQLNIPFLAEVSAPSGVNGPNIVLAGLAEGPQLATAPPPPRTAQSSKHDDISRFYNKLLIGWMQTKE